MVQIRKRTCEGIALVTVLLFSALLLMMVLALFQAVQGGLFVSQNYRDETTALYLAEVGLMDAVAHLENDPTWTEGFDQKSVPGIEGVYSVEFNTSGSGFTEFHSVNNSDGTSDENFRGPGMVPGGCISLICTAQVGRQTRTVEALVYVGGGTYPAEQAIMTTGKIKIEGDVAVDGRAGIGENTEVPGDVHSNLNDSSDNLVTWNGSGTAQFLGKVSSVGSSANAVNLSGATPSEGIETGAAPVFAPDVNILAKISANSGAPSPAIGSGTTVLTPPSGDTKLYYSGDLNLQGDLVLEGVELYVDGSLTVNGSVSGSGAVYVGGDTTFQGDARITAATPDQVSLFSEGNVKLSGFNGSEYMDSLAQEDPEIHQAWNQLSDSIRDYHDQLSGSPVFGQFSTIDNLSQEISYGTSNPVTQPGRQHNATGRLLGRLAHQPNSTAKAKMATKLTQLYDLFYSHANGSAGENWALYNLDRGRLVTGAFDAAIDNYRYVHVPYMLSYVDNIDYNSLGSAYFQGLLFTHGSIYADAEVTVLGALVTRDNGSQESVTINGQELDPGDIYLGHRTKVRYIEEFFKPKDPGSDSGAMGAEIVLWIGR